MGVRDLWHRTLVYFGLAEDESLYDDLDDDVSSSRTHDGGASARYERERQNVRRIDRDRERSSSSSGGSSRRSSGGGLDDIFSDERPTSRPRRGSAATAEPSPRASRSSRDSRDPAATAMLRSAPTEDTVTTAVRVHVIQPRSFNDAQQIADRFKIGVPVIVNLQIAEPELSKRLIDFGSGLTYALDGGMQRIAEKVFLLTPKNVEVSAEDRQRLVEQGFFNPT